METMHLYNKIAVLFKMLFQLWIDKWFNSTKKRTEQGVSEEFPVLFLFIKKKKRNDKNWSKTYFYAPTWEIDMYGKYKFKFKPVFFLPFMHGKKKRLNSTRLLYI